MNYLLSKTNLHHLTRFLRRRVLLAFDFDGTLAPIVADRAVARMRRQTVQLLTRVCALYPCAVISGRSHEDVHSRLEALPLRHVVGHHGLDATHLTSTGARSLDSARALLADVRRKIEGLEIEDKRFSLAVHYRGAKRRRAVSVELARALRSLPSHVRVVPGKCVYDLVPAEAPHKGDALDRVRALEAVDAAVYVGDDVTDEDVFRLANPDRLLAIRVGASRRSAAPYYLRDQRELDGFLGHIVGARTTVG